MPSASWGILEVSKGIHASGNASEATARSSADGQKTNLQEIGEKEGKEGNFSDNYVFVHTTSTAPGEQHCCTSIPINWHR